MTERKFIRALSKPGSAALFRENVSAAVRHTTSMVRPQISDPIDYEAFIIKNWTLLQNDPQRELLLFPLEDYEAKLVSKPLRTTRAVPSLSSSAYLNSNKESHCIPFHVRQCINGFLRDCNIVTFNYEIYSGSWIELPNLSYFNNFQCLQDQVFEFDDENQKKEDFTNSAGITKEGYILKGSEASSNAFMSMTTKSFKRRWMSLRQEIDGTCIIEFHKDINKTESKGTICLDFCHKVLKNPRRGKYSFELKMIEGHKCVILAAENDEDLHSWLETLNRAIQSKSENTSRKNIPINDETSIPSPTNKYGTLKSLEFSKNPELMKYSRETEYTIAQQRKENRIDLFLVYPDLCFRRGSFTELIDHSYSKIEIDTQISKFRFFFSCDSLDFNLKTTINGNICHIEPFFTSVAIFDVKKGKITEEFRFDVNHKLVKEMITDKRVSNQNDFEDDCQDYSNEWITNPEGAIFSLNSTHTDLFMVMRIEKVFSGSISSTSDGYLKSSESGAGKIGTRLHKLARITCQRMGSQYRMPFAWAAKPLFKFPNCLDTSSEFGTVYRQESNKLTDEDIIKYLNELKSNEKLRNVTIIPAKIIVTIRELKSDQVPNNCLTSSHLPIVPFTLPISHPPVFEVQQFFLSDPQGAHSFNYYVNLLYVFPKCLKYDGQKIFTKARNICCVIEFRDSDEEDAVPLKVIFGRPGLETEEFVSRVTTSITHHNSNPDFYEEVKILLPIILNDKQHILFTFYHVSCSNKAKDLSIETPIGYSWLSIYPHRGRLNIDEQILTVSSHLPTGYLSYKPLGLGKGFSGPEIKWVENGKELFKVDFKLVSSISPSDPHLHSFLVHVDRILDIKNYDQDSKDLDSLSVSSGSNNSCQISGSDSGREISKFVQIQHAMPKILKSLQDSDISDVIRFFPILMTQLFKLLVITTCDDVSQNIVKTIIFILHNIHDVNKEEVVKNYVEHTFTADSLNSSFSKTTLHEELIRSLVSLLRSDNSEFINNLLAYSSFFFKITIKSMVHHLSSTNRIKMNRHERFSAEYHSNLTTFIDLFLPQIMQKYRSLPNETKSANSSLAFFLCRCFSFMNRGFIFKLIKLYLDKFYSVKDTVTLNSYKFEFLAIITAYEHHVPLNLPLLLAKTKNSKQNLIMSQNPLLISDDFVKEHFTVGIILQEVKSALIEVNQVRGMAISVFRNLLVKHSFDDRYSSKSQMSRIARLYFPFISILLDNINRMYISGYSLNNLSQSLITKQTDSDTTSSCKSSSTLISINSSKRVSFFEEANIQDSEDTTNKYINFKRNSNFDSNSLNFSSNRDSSYLQYIAGTVSITNSGLSTITNENPLVNAKSEEFFPLNEIDHSSALPSPNLDYRKHSLPVKAYSSTVPDSKLALSLANQENNFHHQRSQSLPLRFDKLNAKEIRDLLIIYLWIMKHVNEDLLIECFHHSNDIQIIQLLTLTEMCLYEFKCNGKKCSSSKQVTNKASTLPSRITFTKFDEEGNISENISNEASIYTPLLNANLATEVGLIALDILGLISYHLKERILENDGDNTIMKKVFSIYLTFLQLGQSETLLKHLFASLRSFVNKFPSFLFSGNPNMVGKLCLELLRCASSKIVSVRNESAALLYLLMRANFDNSNGMAMTRIHLQVIISISRLLGDSELVLLNNPRFQESLAIINNYAGSDKGMQGGRFPSQVKDLTKKVRTVLMATAAMKEHENDSEMLLDLQHHLANSYAETSPALRRTWLESMARNHVKNENYSEAAQCLAHIAALEAEYLKSKNSGTLSAKDFSNLSPNILKDEEFIHSSKREETNINEEQFSEESLISNLENAVDLFTRAERHEMVPEIYKLMIPFYEKTRNCNMLSRIYKNIGDSYDKVILAQKTGKRLLGTYYRVAFFGKDYFEEESGKEYIYKEPKVTSLPEISQRLRELYGTKFGANNVKLIMSEKEIDEKKDCDPRFAYIQITHVLPYNHILLEKNEPERLTDFEKVNNVNKFMFETPFSLADPSKPRTNDCEQQCKKRTIIVTEYHLPYLVKRVLVTSKRVQVLSPIEVAIDEMETRVKKLEEVTFSDLPDLKRLQLTLQGSVSVQVNSGPLTYARAFLKNEKSYSPKLVNKLKYFFRQFVSVCEASLQLNERLIASDQQEYHQSLRKNFIELVDELHDCCIQNEALAQFQNVTLNESEDVSKVQRLTTVKSIQSADNLSESNSTLTSKSSSIEIFDYISGSSNA